MRDAIDRRGRQLGLAAQEGYSGDFPHHLAHYLDEKFKYVRFEICVAPNIALSGLQRVLFELSWPLRTTF